jgi:putative transcriptional regulator
MSYNKGYGGFMNNLKKYRTKAKLTSDKLAKKTGVTRQYIGKLEKGVCEPSIRLAYKIADALKKSVFTIWPKG